MIWDRITFFGAVIPQQGYAMLKAVDVAAIYGPGTNIPEAAREVLGVVQKERMAA